MEFRVLGPLSITRRGVDLTPSAPKQRQMMALFLLNPRHVVSMDQFIDELWDGNPSPTAVASVHTYIMQLRRLICDRPEAGRPGLGTVRQRLITDGHAYRLDVRRGELDLDEFEERAQIGRELAARHEHAPAAAHLRAALSIWRRAPAVPDVLTGPLLTLAVRALDITRLELFGQRIWAELHLGRHHELISELSALGYQCPTNEVFLTQLMVALARSGRRADALQAFHRYRSALWEELRVTPPLHLHELYTDILNSHPRLEISADMPTTHAP